MAAVAHVAGDRTGLVERRGEGDNAPARAAAIGRLDADGAGEGGGLADRTAGIGGRRAGAKPCCNRCRRAAGRAAGHQRLVGARGPPGIGDRSVTGAFVGRAHGEFVHVELAQHHRAVVPQIGGDGRFVARFETVENMAAGLGMDAFGGKQVLDPERNAFQRTAPALRKPGFGGRCHGTRLVGGNGDEGIQFRIGSLDGREIGLGQLRGGNAAGLQLVAGFGNGEAGQVAHDRMSLLDSGKGEGIRRQPEPIRQPSAQGRNSVRSPAHWR